MTTDAATRCPACQANDLDEAQRCPHCDYPCAGGVEGCAECRSLHAFQGTGPKAGA